MAHIRTYKEVLALEPTAAELKLIEGAKAGNVCVFNDGQLPDTDQTEDSGIRAEILRFLIVGGCDDCVVDPIGLGLSGAVVTGFLNLDLVSAPGVLSLTACRFQETIQLFQSQFASINMSDSHLSGVSGNSIKVEHSFALINTISSGQIDLSQSTIGGQVLFFGAQILAPKGYAVNMNSTKVTDGLFFHPTRQGQQNKIETPFHAKGGIDLAASVIGGVYAEQITVAANGEEEALRATNMKIDGPARLDGASLKGQTNFTGTHITGNLSCKGATFDMPDGDAFNARRMQVAQSFIWRKDANATGNVILDGAHVAELDDNPKSRPDTSHLSIDGFTYNRITEYTAYDAARQNWLRNGSRVGAKFFPQPYTQYAKFLRDTGHDAHARQVLLTRERLVRRYQRSDFNPLYRAWRYLWDGLQLVVVGHGHAPFWSIGWLALLMILATVPAHMAWEKGAFAPNSGPIIVSQGWQELYINQDNPAKVWSGETAKAGWSPPDTNTEKWEQKKFDAAWQPVAPGRDWETFNRYAYAADIVIPLINFGQTDAWAPSTTRDDWGWHLWWLRWVFTIFGWIVTALGAAAITGIIRQE